MKENNNNISCVILDWAGTTVDFGCFAPLNAFTRVFADHGLPISIEEARRPMGLAKKDHIRELLKIERISALFLKNHGYPWMEDDVERLYADFVPALMKTLDAFCRPIEGVVETVEQLRVEDIMIGSSTGYTTKMMEIVAEGAAAAGYSPDALVTPDETGLGRPYPYMIFRNMEKLGVYPPHRAVKVGDTVSDIAEGKNAGVWSVGVITGSSELGLDRLELASLSASERLYKFRRTQRNFYSAGADFVINEITELPMLIEKINRINAKNAGKEENIL